MGMRVEIAIEGRAGQGAGDRDFSIGGGGDFTDFDLQGSLGDGGSGKEGQEECGEESWSHEGQDSKVGEDGG
jgi:hypothetical protein